MQALPDKMTINCEYSSACFASNERKKSTKNDRKSIEISASLNSLIGNIVVQDTFPGSQVDVYVELIQDDGGSYAASESCNFYTPTLKKVNSLRILGINATILALVDAGIPIRDYVVACTATMTHSLAMIDINSFERGRGSPELTVGILPSDTQIIVLELSNLIHLLYLDDVIRVAIEGCKKIHQIMERAVREKFLKSRDFKD